MEFVVSLSRKKTYTEEGAAFVEAATPEAARKLALDLAQQGGVEFQPDAGGTEVVADSLHVTATSPV
jgi:hypothetical protein